MERMVHVGILNRVLIFIVAIFALRSLLRSSWGRCCLPATTFWPELNLEAPFCVVCHEKLTRREWVWVLPNCKHCYHVKCMDAWLEDRSICPTCRSEIIPAIYDDDELKELLLEGEISSYL